MTSPHDPELQEQHLRNRRKGDWIEPVSEREERKNANHKVNRMSPMKRLTLEEYRHLVALDEPFVDVDVDVGRRDTDSFLRVALDFLEREHEQSDGHRTPSRQGDARRRLRALLTVRFPTPLPRTVLESIDALLQLERVSRLLTQASELPRSVLTETRGSSTQVAVWKGDITTLVVDAIVNAANERLLGCFTPFHACIDNAIHSAAGPRLREDCHRIVRAQGGTEATANAKVTRGYNLRRPSFFPGAIGGEGARWALRGSRLRP